MTGALVDFLNARYDEREKLALAVAEDKRSWNTARSILNYGGHDLDEVVDWVYVDGAAEHMAANDPDSVLLDLEAKRELLKFGVAYEGSPLSDWMLRVLAQPFASHADYLPQWAPQEA